VADALDAVVASGLEPEFWSAFLASLPDLPAGGPVVLPNLVEGSPALAALPLLCTGAGLLFHAEEMDRAPYVPLPASFDGYLEALGGKERHELRRKMRRAESLVPGLTYRIGGTANALASDVASFIDLHRRSSPAKDAFMTGRMAAFFGEVAQRFFAAGQLRLAFLGGPAGDIASVFQIEYDGALLLYNSGFDPAMRAANPGLVLVARCIEDAIGRGLAEYDFLRGTERYKYDLGGRDRVVYRGTIGRP
jgi:CelD/BcsL family acetyltransferase involved in cellulose biosynthesis